MWESRVLCEISKRRWKSFCDFHGRDISTAVRDRVGPSQFWGYPDIGRPGDRRSCGLLGRRLSDDGREISARRIHAALSATARRSHSAGLIRPTDE
jgi:hypothetical protein